MRLKLVPESSSAIPGQSRAEKFIEGADASEILDKWRDTSPWWRAYDYPDFRQRLVEWSGADVDMPEEDDVVLDAVVRALGPEVVVLEE